MGGPLPRADAFEPWVRSYSGAPLVFLSERSLQYSILIWQGQIMTTVVPFASRLKRGSFKCPDFAEDDPPKGSVAMPELVQEFRSVFRISDRLVGPLLRPTATPIRIGFYTFRVHPFAQTGLSASAFSSPVNTSRSHLTSRRSTPHRLPRAFPYFPSLEAYAIIPGNRVSSCLCGTFLNRTFSNDRCLPCVHSSDRPKHPSKTTIDPGDRPCLPAPPNILYAIFYRHS